MILIREIWSAMKRETSTCLGSNWVVALAPPATRTILATATRTAVAVLLRQARAERRPMPREFVDTVWASWDAGTRRAILALYRSADPDALGAQGSRLGELACPALVVWGARDPYIDASFGRAYADALPNAELVELDDAGHWPWIDRLDVIDRVTDFLDASAAPTIGST